MRAHHLRDECRVCRKNPSLEAIMAIFLLIAIAAVVVGAVIATLVQVARDGYRAVPTRADLPRLSDFTVRSDA
jgi:hypothetical protein